MAAGFLALQEGGRAGWRWAVGGRVSSSPGKGDVGNSGLKNHPLVGEVLR